jgi:hypothetical protein
MDSDKGNIVKLIGYQRKALRLANIGLTNESVAHLFKEKMDQRKELEKIKSYI